MRNSFFSTSVAALNDAHVKCKEGRFSSCLCGDASVGAAFIMGIVCHLSQECRLLSHLPQQAVHLQEVDTLINWDG